MRRNPSTPAATFAHLDWHLEQEPADFLSPFPGRAQISLTAVGEYLMDTVGLGPDAADALAYAWAEQPRYAHLSPMPS